MERSKPRENDAKGPTTIKQKKQAFENLVKEYLESNPIIRNGNKQNELEVRFGTNHKLAKPLSNYILVDFSLKMPMVSKFFVLFPKPSIHEQVDLKCKSVLKLSARILSKNIAEPTVFKVSLIFHLPCSIKSNLLRK